MRRRRGLNELEHELTSFVEPLLGGKQQNQRCVRVGRLRKVRDLETEIGLGFGVASKPGQNVAAGEMQLLVILRDAAILSRDGASQVLQGAVEISAILFERGELHQR